jgi:hypothetical protein
MHSEYNMKDILCVVDNIILFHRLRAAGLFTLARLVEGGPGEVDGGARKRIVPDRSLLTALVDRWRPETHTFHLPCGEVAPTLQDVAYLFGLPIVGPVVGPRVVPPSWKDDLEGRFAAVQREPGLGEVQAHPNARGPSRKWLLQFRVRPSVQEHFHTTLNLYAIFILQCI